MHPQIPALHELQNQDRQLSKLERRLELIPQRLAELDADLAKLEDMLAAERIKCEETRAFQRNQEGLLADEEDHIRGSKARTSQVKTARELNAAQREVETTRRMAAARADEIVKIKQGVAEAEQRIAAMDDGLVSLRAQAEIEKVRLAEQRDKAAAKLKRLRTGRGDLTSNIEDATLRTYERIRKRLGGVAFVAVREQRCSACKMIVPHLQYVTLKKGDEILNCETCGRLMFWGGHFDEEDARRDEAVPKAAPTKVRRS